LYPNPAIDQLVIDCTPPFDAPITLLDLQGRQCRVYAANGESRLRLDLSGLSPGVYFLQTERGAFRLIKSE
jgi:hypothetical protein